MATNYGRDKRRIEEMKRKRREEKKMKKIGAPPVGAAPQEGAPASDASPVVPQ